MRVVAIGTLGALMALTAPDGAAPARRTARSSPVPAALSIGSPNGGRLDGGSRLIEGPYLRVVPYYADSSARWGLPLLVNLLDRAARCVARRFPDAVLSVGDLSRKGGGELDRHRSHESGRDADVGFYFHSATRHRPVLPSRFVAVAPSGQAATIPSAIFDDARNWAFVEALLEDGGARVSHIFVASHIRARLLRYAEQISASVAVRKRAAEVMMQPTLNPHDDHFHVRIACPPDQHGKCVEDPILRTRHAPPPAARTRERSGTDDDRPRVPTLRPEAAASAALPAQAPSLQPLPPPRVLTSPSGRLSDTESLPPLANSPGVDNVER